ncbi:peptidoglycan DD-metalloendopeptidase family protein [Thiorhodovibrio frisius]|uniref:Metalloendopeptidase-like membrane protein n=1 Tax=Thiorhodovibrio frisius TaxID=631362 RepID=H8Z5J2_9GAMM|nr:peptidoglycan DD-metalloendopeptidase family protein [Thiorhodovibrio frisius]EIC20562.1 metalloendopeptidase-like membrane protein [Thiorhodovibrio frisius]WPL21310.1 Murein hydrolase activator NlpD precursor [Thiorhodovibrio frisius]
MRDYKFRVRGHGFRRQPDRRSRRALRLGSLALGAGISYAVAQLMMSTDSVPRTTSPSGDPEVIELPLPPGHLQDQPLEHPPALGQMIDSTDASAGKQSADERPIGLSDSLSTPVANTAGIQDSNQAHPTLVLEDQHQRLADLAPDLRQLIGINEEDLHELSLANAQPLAVELNTNIATLQPQSIDQAQPSLSSLPPGLKPALKQGPFRLDYQVQPGDTLGTILEQQGQSGRMVYQILDQVSDQHRRRLEQIRPGETIHLHFDQALELTSLEFKLDATQKLLVSRAGETISTSVESTPTEPRRQCLTAVVDNSLYGAAKSAGIPDQVTQRAINIFRHQINFSRQTRKGDQLSVLFEQIYAGDEPIKTGPVLAVEFTNGSKQYAAVRYTTSKGVTDYYSADGQPVNKGKHTFLRAPLTYTRVSSGFSMNRMHPILRRVRPHPGIDFAAPAGRRVLAAADGQIHFKGRKSGYGNIVILRHGSRYETRYAHLMRFARGISNGGRVKRGETIGYVGQTGLATGPHLHYEIRINGTPVNPLTAKLPFLNEFDDKEKARFRRQTRPLLAELQRNRERALLVDARSFDQPDRGLPVAERQSIQ